VAKKIGIIVAIVVVVLIIIVLALPMFIDANRFKPTLETDLGKALGRQVQIGNISLSIFSGGVSVDSVSIADDPAFSHSPFLTAKELKAGVSLLPLIFSKRLEVQSFTITEPQVTLLRSPSGRWNYSSLGAASPNPQPATPGEKKPAEANPQESQPQAAQAQPASGSSAAANFSVGKLKLSNGLMTVGTVGAGAEKTQKYEDLNLDASDLSYTAQFPFELTAKTPGGGSIKLEGKAGPVNQTDASLTPFTATVSIDGLDLASTGFIDPSSGISGVIDFHGEAASNGQDLTSKGTAKASKIRLAAHAHPATVPINIDYAASYDLKRSAGALTEGQVHIGSALAALSGTFDSAGATTSVQMKMDGKKMPVTDLEGVLPAIGVTLPSGASLKSGTLDTTLAISGPVDKLVITGPVDLSDAKLAGFNLKQKLGALASFAGLGGGRSSDTEIQTLSAKMRVDPAGTRAEDLKLVVESIGAMTGNGTVSSTGQLDCHMVAKLTGSSAAGMVTSALSTLSGGGAKGGIPFKITGTTSSPVFAPDVGGMFGKGGTSTGSSAEGAASSILGGLMKKKPKQQ
jgi:AsmA protein